MSERTLAIVIATIRQDSINRWLRAWQPEFRDTQVYVIEDNPTKTFTLNYEGYGFVKHVSWEQIDRDLGSYTWIIPRRSSAVKSYGFLLAYRDGHDYIWTLDDDCLPEPGRGYLPHLPIKLEDEYPDDSWWNTLNFPGTLYPRGYPYGIRQDTQQVMIHHGLWSGVPDLDGITALEHYALRLDSCEDVFRIPTGKFFAMCGMNLAFRREMVPAMYFGLQGRKRRGSKIESNSPFPFDRFDDIWAGLFAKKVCDNLGYAVTSGAPSIIHSKESDPTQRVIKEGPGIAANEILWRIVADAQIPFGLNTIGACYDYLASCVNHASNDLPFPDYWKELANAMHIWTELCT